MLIKVDFKYAEEKVSFLNKSFTIGAVIFFLFLLLVGYSESDIKTTIDVLGFISIIYLVIGIKTIKIINKKNYFKKNGIKCQGFIKDMKITRGHRGLTNTYDNRYHLVSLIVQYVNPYNNQIEEFVTDYVNGNPFTYLSSLAVTVYVLPDGRKYATDFKKIKNLKDAVKYQEWYIAKQQNQKTAKVVVQNKELPYIKEYNETYYISTKDKTPKQVVQELDDSLSTGWKNTKKVMFTKENYNKFLKKFLPIYIVFSLILSLVFFAINILFGIFVTIILIGIGVIYFVLFNLLFKN